MTETQKSFPKSVWFDHDKNGRKVAYRWSYQAGRAIRIALADAELLVATGQATDIKCHPIHGPKEATMFLATGDKIFDDVTGLRCGFVTVTGMTDTAYRAETPSGHEVFVPYVRVHPRPAATPLVGFDA